MKANKTFIFTGLIALVFSGLFFSCEGPVGLGEKLDILGPIVQITSPVPRKTVGIDYELKGNVTDSSGVDRLVINAHLNREPISKQWRYYKGSWEVSENSGASWQSLAGAQWNGDSKSASWVVPINMEINGAPPSDGEYLFTVQAWDAAGFSDDNSFRTIVLIHDNDLPKVDISKPSLYTRYADYDGSAFTVRENMPSYDDDVYELNSLHGMVDGDTSAWQKPEMIGKFLTQGFQLQWQIDDEHDIWSFELSFYDVNDTSVVIDNDPNTSLPDSYYFRYWQNLGEPPDEPRPQDYPKPNGTISIPTLHDSSKLGIGTVGDGNYSFKSVISTKTTVRVVSRCFDAAGHVNQEKTLGYFIYWEKAGKPWIIFTEGMGSLSSYANIPPEYGSDREKYLTEKAFMIYPGRSIKSTALQAQGVTHVEFSVYEYIINGSYGAPASTPKSLSYMESMAKEGVDFEYVANSNKTRIRLKNEVRSNGAYSQIFSWELKPPPQTGFNVISAQAYSGDIVSDEFFALFRVQDISFPIFGEPSPPASDPLFRHINTANSTIKIEGIVTDATEVKSLTMVWINPQSKNFSAMSQLQYFRDQDYYGWKQAKTLTKGGASGVEQAASIYPDIGGNTYPFDPAFPNRLWNINPVFDGVNDDERQVFKYSITIDLDAELNISPTKQALGSQMFLLRAENPDGRVTIITYAPQGDTLVPTIEITEARVLRSGVEPIIIRPRQYEALRQFQDGDELEVSGTWNEDSTGYLNVNNYLFNNVVFKINGNEITGSNFTTRTITTSSGTNNATSGTFVFKATLGSGTHIIQTSTMKDTLVVDASVKDIGGNAAESSASWLIQSDRLRFLRISCETDGAFNLGKPIRIYLEFSKPVQLRNQDIRPELILNSANGNTARAIYEAGQGIESTRQYFSYTVGAGQNTTALDVTGLYYNGVVGANDYNNPNYAFVWLHQGELGANETMSITMNNAHANDTVVGYTQVPMTSANNRSLMSNKEVTVDTTAPTFSSVTATPQGWLNAGEITIRVTFSEPVNIGATAPYLILTGGASPNNRALYNRVSGNTITFVYTINAGDNTNGNELQITGHGGQILDLPGTALADNGIGTRTITGVYLDTSAPSAPTINIRSGNPLAVISNTINGTATSGTSGGTGQTAWNPNVPPSGNNIVDLKNVYQGTLNLQITQNSNSVGSGDTQTLEYSTNFGKDWIAYTGGTGGINWDTNNPQGLYEITARQIDRAGNVSQWSKPVVLKWDRDPLITSITSTNANGTYTNNSVRHDSINITVNLRKQLTFTGGVGINLNSRTGAISANPTGGVSQIQFDYPVGTSDNTPGADKLNVSSFSGVNAADGDGVNVSSMITTAAVAAGNTLADLKSIYVKTEPLTVVNPQPAFTAGTVNADGSYNTTLVINYSGNIVRGTGFITITQSATNYRIPAVLTEAQRNKYRSIANFDNFYTRGTNGFSGNSADTTVKYILNYNIDPTNLTDTQHTTFATAFRNAERIQINANATSSVIINGNQLTIQLTGNNALQVPGAAYTVAIDQGFVQDALSSQSPVGSYNITAGGVAKPFIRINRQQETIELANASTTQPRFVPTFSMTTNARMDTRTPGATIRYNVASQTYTATASNWATGTTAITTLPTDNLDNTNNNTNAMPTGPGVPTSTGGTQYNAATPVSIGDNNYTGYIWRVNAAAFVGTTSSASSEEAAFRTVLTYQAVGMAGTGTRQPIGNGMQIWVRGGDAIGSSSVPGFPLTWDDDWSSLQSEGKRAGIRLMRANTVGTNLNTSTWYWVTWEVNVETYFDIILGNTETNPTVSTILKYGPRQWAYQAAGWTAFKEHYRMFPGKHRWLNTTLPTGLVGTAAVTINGGASFNAVGALNFSNTWTARPEF